MAPLRLAFRVTGRMIKRSVQAIVAAALFAAPAGQVFTEPPPIIQLVRVPGGGGQPKPYGGLALEVIGMSTITGLPESWFLEAHPSFASIEDLDQRVKSSLPRDSQAMIGV